MTVLLRNHRRRCDSTCHAAKRPTCRCICAGRNHGIGRAEAERRLEAQRGEVRLPLETPAARAGGVA